MVLDINKIISYEDHFIMMLWEKNLLKQRRKPEEINRELEDLAIALDSIRCKSGRLPLSFSEFFLLSSVEDMLKGQKIKKKHSDILDKIKTLLNKKPIN